jgi:uncharacterized protein
MRNLMLMLFTVVSINCFSQTKNFIDQNYIEVTGRAEIEIIPNEIYLKIVLNEKDFKGKENLDEVEKSMINKLVEIGIDVSKDLAIKDMASNFKNYWIKTSEINSIKIFQLKVIDAKTAGNVFKELESLNISNITIEKVDHSNIQEFKLQVKLSAIKAAKQKAESLAETISQSCGRAIYIEEITSQPYRPAQGYPGASSNIMIRNKGDFSSSNSPEIEFEKIYLDYAVLVRFELK